MENDKYHLVNQINGHDGSPIRSLAIGPFGDLITGSQDCMLKRWTINDDGSVEPFGGSSANNSIAHSHWVTAITSLAPEVCPDVYPNGCIVTGCMDKNIRVFDGLTSELLSTLPGHQKGVISFSWLVHASQGIEQGVIQLISGSWDGSARIWDMHSTACVHILSGHENGVNVLGIQSSPHLGFDIVVTTSTGESINSTPCNFQIRFWNASTGLEIKTGDNHKPLRIADHTGSIRSISGISSAAMFSLGDSSSNNGMGCFQCTFMTSSNDGTIKIRKLEYASLDENASSSSSSSSSSSAGVSDCFLRSECTATLLHPSEAGGGCPFILHCTTNHTDTGTASDLTGIIISSGEDGSVLVWNSTSNQLIQAIAHPTSVWCCTPLLPSTADNGSVKNFPNKRTADDMLMGDDSTADTAVVDAAPETRFATAGHDGIVRIFSNQPLSKATPEQTALQISFQESLREYLFKKNKGPSAAEIEKAPKWEDCSRPENVGKSDQAVAVFNKNGTLIAAQWSMVSGTWIEIGVVTGSGDGGDLNGVTYDHIMPVEVETSSGVQTLKLGYNNGENPFLIAKRFVDSNGLDNSYVQQIADWILQKQQQGGGGGAGAGNTIDMSDGTGGVTSSVGSAPTADFTGSVHFPIKNYCSYEDVPNKAQFAKLVAKIESLNAGVGGAEALSLEDFAQIGVLVEVLQNTSRYHTTDLFDWAALKPIITKICNLWVCTAAAGSDGDSTAGTDEIQKNRIASVFPGFDVLRMVCCHASGIALLTHRHNERAVHKAFTNAVRILIAAELSMTADGAVAAFAPSILTALRCLCTAMKQISLQSVVMSVFAQLSGVELARFFECVGVYGTSTSYSMNIHSAACNLLYNVSLYYQTAHVGGISTPAGLLIYENCSGATFQMLSNIANLDNGTANNDIIYKVGCSVATSQLYAKRTGGAANAAAVADCVKKVQVKLITTGITEQNRQIFDCYNDLKRLLGV